MSKRAELKKRIWENVSSKVYFVRFAVHTRTNCTQNGHDLNRLDLVLFKTQSQLTG